MSTPPQVAAAPPAPGNDAPPPTSPPSVSNATAPPPSTPVIPSAPPPSTPVIPSAPTPSTPVTPSAPPPEPVSAATPPLSPSPPTPAPPPLPLSIPPPSPPSSTDVSPPPPPPPPRNSGNAPTPVIRSAPPPPPPPRSSGRSTPARSPPPPSPPSSSSSSSQVPTGAIVGIAAGAVILLILISLIFFCGCKKKKRRSTDHTPSQAPYKEDDAATGVWRNNAPLPSGHAFTATNKRTPSPTPMRCASAAGSEKALLSSNSIGSTRGVPRFAYEELAMATNGFSNANLLGQGGFGYVHKGTLANGKEFAVKQLKAGSGQGEREFQAEIDIIGRVHHRHLVSLIGHCITGTQRLLVYEFVPNNTLEFHLHGKDRPTMEWALRRKIAIGSAKGLAYLHEDCNPRIIHRDIKAANILLDFQFEPKVADFGLARITSDVNTHVSTRVMGTFGYLAPEYASSGKLSEKSDVFSFGVMLLELITGRRPVNSSSSYTDDSLVDWARPLLGHALEDGDFTTLVDPRLPQNEYDHNEMARMVACAAASVRHAARCRPKMSRILRALEGDMSLADLNEGVQHGNNSSVYSSHGSSDYDNSQYREDMRRFRRMAFASNDIASSEYSGAHTGTSDYGVPRSTSSSSEVENRTAATGPTH